MQKDITMLVNLEEEIDNNNNKKYTILTKSKEDKILVDSLKEQGFLLHVGDHDYLRYLKSSKLARSVLEMIFIRVGKHYSFIGEIDEAAECFYMHIQSRLSVQEQVDDYIWLLLKNFGGFLKMPNQDYLQNIKIDDLKKLLTD
jgi:hypothetical protein